MPTIPAISRRPEYALGVLYSLSGFAALCYETVWQRALFTLVGVNVEAVTIVVAVFLLGLGLGAPVGARLAARVAPVLALAGVEAAMALFGVGLVPALALVDQWIARTDSTLTVVAGALLLLPPTLLMGSTFPLAAAFVSGDRARRAGRAVSVLYVANTLGSAGACFFIAWFAMREFGLTGSARVAALCNVTAATGCLGLYLAGRGRQAPRDVETPGAVDILRVSLRVAMLLSGIAGFISISYEILWVRAWTFYLASAPETFSMLLGSFLLGISAGSAAVARAATRLNQLPAEKNLRITAWLVMSGCVLSFFCVPALARLDSANYGLVILAGAALGAVFPLVLNAAVGAGASTAPAVARLYMANIAGSVAGSLLTGYFLLNYFSLRQLHVGLAGAGLVTATVLGGWRRTAPAALVVGVVLTAASGTLFEQLYERLMFKADFDPEVHQFIDVVENRFGVVSTDDEKTVYGEGAYDGFLETDVRTADTPIRPLSLSLFHANPRRVLIIGVAAGAWAQIVSQHPQLESLTAVEINPGYLEIIRRYPVVAPVLSNPKANIVIADARRWLNTHPDARFDVIFADTMQHWRSHASNLLSREFLQLAKAHLAPGGMMYYNTTHSFAAQATAVHEFAHGMRFGPFVALSDSPLDFQPERWRAMLTQYRIDGKPILDPKADAARIDELLGMVTKRFDAPKYDRWGMETEAHLRARVAGQLLVTDDNMGTEWRGGAPKL